MDNRTPEEFAKDIKAATATEKELMIIYVNYLNSRKRNDKPYTWVDNGIDNTGEFIPDDKNVDCRADFLLRREGQADRPIEIKFCRPLYNRFHLKTNQVKYYIEHNICIVNFMGIDTATPSFCILPPKKLQELLEDGKHEGWMWGKPCLRIYNKEMEWFNYAKGNQS